MNNNGASERHHYSGPCKIAATSQQLIHTSKQAHLPGEMNWMCPDTAFSLTPDSIQSCPSSAHARFTAMRAPKLSTHPNTRLTGPPSLPPVLQCAAATPTNNYKPSSRPL